MSRPRRSRTGSGSDPKNDPSGEKPTSGWLLEESGGDSPTAFYTGVSSNNEVVSVKINSGLVHRMQAMIFTGKYPKYQTPSDILRDSIHHWVRFREQNVPETNDVLLAIQEAHRQLEERKIQREHIDLAKGTAEEMLYWANLGREAFAQQVGMKAIETIDAHSNPFMKECYRTVLQKDLGPTWWERLVPESYRNLPPEEMYDDYRG